MGNILEFEADRRAFIITINSFGTELTMDDREKLYPTCGKLYPDGLARLARCEDYDQVKAVADCYPVSCLPVHAVLMLQPHPLSPSLTHNSLHLLFKCVRKLCLCVCVRNTQPYLLVPATTPERSLLKTSFLRRR